jgi:hypothetical protein
VVVLWLATYPALLALRHLTLRTNGYDLSAFDYALWSSLHGRIGEQHARRDASADRSRFDVR